MPYSNLPAEANKLFERIYNEALKQYNGDKKKAAKVAWAALKKAGWSKGADGKWHKSADIQEFSLAIRKAPFDKESGERRWWADTSDTDPDLYDDNMSMELFQSFINRIEGKEQPPEEFRSDFWSGGMPYVSVSHYPDLNGDAVPGEVRSVYIDGKFFKAKGIFNSTPLGDACWNAVRNDFELKRAGVQVEQPVRISIAFLDYKHKHRDSGTIFERSDTNDICLECLKAILEGERPKREFLDGHLIHLAMTRVPVNQRTIMEVDKSMTTRKEDAASIIGEELAEELDEKAALVGKSEALVIKAEDEEVPEVVEETPEEPVTDNFQSIVDELKAEIRNLAEVVLAMSKKEKKDDEEAEDDEEGVSKKKKAAEEAKKADVEDTAEVAEVDYRQELLVAFSEAMRPVVERLDILISQNTTSNRPVVSAPVRRSIDPNTVQQGVAPTRQPGQPMSIQEFVNRSVGL